MAVPHSSYVSACSALSTMADVERLARDAKAGGGDEGQEETAEVAAAGMTDAEVLKVVVDTVAVSVLRCDPASIMEQVDAPVPSLGLGSMEGVQVGGLRSCDAAKLPVRRKS